MKDQDREFTEFVRGAQRELLRIGTLMAGSRTAGEDLVQDALVRTYRSWSRIDHGAAFSYTRRTMTNLVIDRWRRRHLEAVPSTTVYDDVPGGRPSPGPEGTCGMRGVDDRDAIVRELAALSRRERTAVVLRYYVGLSEREVAHELGVSVGTVKSTCSRALARLRVAAAPTDEATAESGAGGHVA